MGKNIYVCIVWSIIGITLITTLNWRSKYTQRDSGPIIGRTYRNLEEDKNSIFGGVKSIDVLSKGDVSQYEIDIYLDLSASVGYSSGNISKEDALISIVQNVKQQFPKGLFNTRIHFFGTGVSTLTNEDVLIFSKKVLEEQKAIRFPSGDRTSSLEGWTDIHLTLEHARDQLNSVNDDRKESLVIVVSDDIHSTRFRRDSTDERRLREELIEIKQEQKANFYLIKYGGKASRPDKEDFIESGFSEVFEVDKISLDKIASEIKRSVYGTMYLNDFIALKADLTQNGVESKARCKQEDWMVGLSDSSNEYINSNAYLSFLGSGDPQAENINIKSGNTHFLNFQFINNYRFFPVRLSLKSIKLCWNRGDIILLQTEFKDDQYANRFMPLNNYRLDAGGHKIWTVPVSSDYKSSFWEALVYKVRNPEYLAIEYEIELLDETNPVYQDILLRKMREGGDLPTNVRVEDGKIYVAGYQISRLFSDSSDGPQYLLSVHYPPNTASLLATFVFVCLILVLARRALIRPTLEGWNITVNKKKYRTSKRILRLPGFHGEKDVIIKSIHTRIGPIPFRQPRDHIRVSFLVTADRLKKGVVTGRVKKTKLTSNGKLEARYQDDRHLMIW